MVRWQRRLRFPQDGTSGDGSGRLAWRVPKELAVAALFTAGTFLVAWTWSSHPFSLLLLPALAFFLLCLANLVAIESWEWRELRRQQPGGLHPLTFWLASRLPVLLAAFAVICLAAGFRYRLFLPIGCSAGLQWLLMAGGQRLSLDARRALVDAALLAPLFL